MQKLIIPMDWRDVDSRSQLFILQRWLLVIYNISYLEIYVHILHLGMVDHDKTMLILHALMMMGMLLLLLMLVMMVMILVVVRRRMVKMLMMLMMVMLIWNVT